MLRAQEIAREAAMAKADRKPPHARRVPGSRHDLLVYVLHRIVETRGDKILACLADSGKPFVMVCLPLSCVRIIDAGPSRCQAQNRLEIPRWLAIEKGLGLPT